jgi:hypothetical protein
MGGSARAAFEAWFHVLATHCRRDLYLHRVPCPCLSADEDAMLDLVASAQAGDDLRLRRRAAGLVHGGRSALCSATAEFSAPRSAGWVCA